MNIPSFYKNKKILITGHSGFKGAWLYFFLKQFGSDVCGYSLQPNDNQNTLFRALSLHHDEHSTFDDIRDKEKLNNFIKSYNPEILFHLAAQPLVIDSHKDPLETLTTNIIGTANIIEVVRNIKSIKSTIIITSDKCYENLNDKREFKESDQLGGIDPYSASKSCAEIVANSYRECFFDKNVRGLATARAGNVIGGGDFSTNRLIPDLIKAIINKRTLQIRNPNATRPWQHVFDVIYGYLLLGMNVYENPSKFSTAYNFSPTIENCVSVKDIITKINNINEIRYEIIESNLYESSFLSLNSNKARDELNWKSLYDIDKTLNVAYEWYNCLIDKKNIYNKSIEQYSKYMELINEKN